MMNRQTNSIYEFGPYRLDVAQHLLLRDGESVPLTPKAFDLLLALVEHRGRPKRGSDAIPSTLSYTDPS